MLSRLKEKITEISIPDLKQALLTKLVAISPEAHSHVRSLFQYQEAQQVYTKLKEKQDREETIKKILQPARQEFNDAQQRLRNFINQEEPQTDFDSPEYKRAQKRKQELEHAVLEAKNKCDLEQNSEMLNAIKSLKDLDNTSETYRLFATSIHYGYFVLLFLFWCFYSIYYFGLYLVDRIPTQRRDLKRAIAQVSEEVQNVALNLNGEIEKLKKSETPKIDEKKKSFADSSCQTEEVTTTTLPPSTPTTTTHNSELPTSIAAVQKEKSFKEKFEVIWDDFLLKNNPINLVLHVLYSTLLMFILVSTSGRRPLTS